MAGTYSADAESLGGMLAFTSTELRVPTWQRSYSWTTREVATFFEDLVRFSERYPDQNIEDKDYFLGSVVFVDRTGYLEILDGQQRIATATILISAMRDVAAEYNGDAAKDIATSYIAKKDPAEEDVTLYHLRLNAYDGTYFRELIQDAGGMSRTRSFHPTSSS